MQKFKFEIGQIVRHKATLQSNATRLVVIGRGTIMFETGDTVLYLVSGERDHWGRPAGEGLYAAAYITETELTEAD